MVGSSNSSIDPCTNGAIQLCMLDGKSIGAGRSAQNRDDRLAPKRARRVFRHVEGRSHGDMER